MSKRALDVTVATIGLFFLAPLIIATGVVVLLAIGHPVFYRQMRPGFKGKPFRLIKFRTMTNLAGPDGRQLEDRERLGSVGRMLRRTSLDELPTLWNVLIGEMSLVGPRPLLIEYLPLYDPVQAHRHDVPGGITGWAQVHGRNELDWDERLALDLWYVDHQSFALDVLILIRTVGQVVRQRGISRRGHATMPRFTGRATGHR